METYKYYVVQNYVSLTRSSITTIIIYYSDNVQVKKYQRL